MSLLRVQMKTPEDFGQATDAMLALRPDALLLSPNMTNFLKATTPISPCSIGCRPSAHNASLRRPES